MSRSVSCLCLLLASTALTPAALAGPHGALSQATGVNYAYGLSGDGHTVVGLAGTSLSPTAVYWADGVLVDPQINLSGKSAFTGISSDGSTLFGHTDVYPSDQPFVLRNGAVTHLPMLGAAAELSGSNADGSWIVGYGPGPGTSATAIVWSGPGWSTLTNLGALPGHLGSAATGISGTTAANADQSVIAGESEADNNQYHAVYWQGGLIHDLGTTGQVSSAGGISADASTIVGTVDPNSSTALAVSWTGPGYTNQTDLGTLGGAYSIAQRVDGDGSVIVGISELANDQQIRVFRYANGHMDDLNALLSDAGVDMNGVILAAPAGISSDGKYIAANSQFADQAYLAYYDDGVGALTSAAEQQASVDSLGQQRQGVATQYDAYSGLLIGDLDRQGQPNTVGAFGLAGSAVAGTRGHLELKDGFSISGGIADGSSDFAGATIGNGLLGAVALRYDASALALGSFHPFAQVGGSAGLLNGADFTRSYPGGSGRGTTTGRLATGFVRLGISGDLDGGDQVSLAGELGARWLSTDAYAESFSPGNPFPGTVEAGDDTATFAKLTAAWSHPLSNDVDLTLRATVGKTLGGTSGLRVATTGFGTLATGITSDVWAEAGAHVTWNLNARSALDLYATGTAGNVTGTAMHFGGGYHYKF